ncbi:MAG TPA: type VI secretion system tube protein Hcp [Thermoanaerobaculia bacterium]|nr:type VI secretion system tube protein Hcp [Thermoanaerobaculia bacterium]
MKIAHSATLLAFALTLPNLVAQPTPAIRQTRAPVQAAGLNATGAPPNGSVVFENQPAETLTVMGLVQRGANTVTLAQRGASPLFFQKCVHGAHFKEVTISMRKAGGTQQEFLVVKLRDVAITSVQRQADGSVLIGMSYASMDGSPAAFNR